MSGGPVFVERDREIALWGAYTGIIYRDPVTERSGKVTAPGSCANLGSCWRGSPSAGSTVD